MVDRIRSAESEFGSYGLVEDRDAGDRDESSLRATELSEEERQPWPDEAASANYKNESPPDIYELAYFRGGSDAVFRLHLLELIQYGCLTMVERRGWFSSTWEIVAAPGTCEVTRLTESESALARKLSVPHTLQQIYQNKLPAIFDAECALYHRRLKEAGFVTTLRAHKTKQSVQTAAGFALFALIFFSLPALHLIPAPVLITIVALLLTVIVGVWFLPELSREGMTHFKDLQERHLPLVDEARRTVFGTPDDSVLLGFALFGASLLIGTPYDAFAKAFGATVSDAVEVGTGIGSDCGGCCGGGCCGGCGGCG